MMKQYYYLVAGLTEYSMDTDKKGFDAKLIREQICEQLSEKDRGLVQLLYTYYDIENIVNIKEGRSKFNSLGNFSREKLEQEMISAEYLPEFIVEVLASYKNPESKDFEGEDKNVALKKSLYTAYYTACMQSKSKFVRDWSEFDLNLRNVCAAFTARRSEMDLSGVIIGDNYVSQSIKRSSAADFGLRGELDYLDKVLNAVSNDQHLVEKEKQIDLLRWDYSQGMVGFDYFSVNSVLSYLIKINIIQRWKDLDPTIGQDVFKQLIGKLINKELI